MYVLVFEYKRSIYSRLYQYIEGFSVIYAALCTYFVLVSDSCFSCLLCKQAKQLGNVNETKNGSISNLQLLEGLKQLSLIQIGANAVRFEILICS